jgi:phosphoribosyl-ATP pyrophosphohydrolase/phosphoribosyl-AMP cyclohydrolase
MKITFNSQGLIPAIAQEARTGQLLMMAWMNQRALDLSVETGQVHYFSRSRQALWRKGETSGHTQQLVDLRLDCDGDALLVRVKQSGPACHTDRPSCFFYDLQDPSAPAEVAPPPAHAIEELQRTIHDRRAVAPGTSYTASLLTGGMDAIGPKVMEEAQELVSALRDESDERVTSEAADLLYHVLVGMESRGVQFADVALELSRRFGVSGFQEKAARK